jgi:hypothetical protein
MRTAMTWARFTASYVGRSVLPNGQAPWLDSMCRPLANLSRSYGQAGLARQHEPL